MSTETGDSATGCSFLSHTPTCAFAPEDFGTDDALMVGEAERFCRERVLTALDRLDAQEPGLMPALICQAGELGLCGADALERFGGLGLGKCLAARIAEAASLNGSFAVTLGVTAGVAQSGLCLFGDDSQRAEHLPGLASGEVIGAFALSEPGSGSDALSLTTRAIAKGGDYSISGTKMWVTNAKWAALFTVFARLEDGGLGAFLVPGGSAGLAVEREESKMGLKGSSTARVTLDEVRVPRSALLYAPGKGHAVALNALNLGRLRLAAMCLGQTREALRQAATYALERKQFGKTIALHPLIRRKLAMGAALYFAAESCVYRTGALVDSAFAGWDGSPSGARVAAEEFAVESAICKVFATEAQASVTDEALQCFGGYGFSEEFPLARLYRDARVTRIFEGTNEVNRLFIADRLLKRAEGAETSDDLLSALARKALVLAGDDDLRRAAFADLAILAFVDQSARLRASRFGGLHGAIYGALSNWLGWRAAGTFQRATGEAVALPRPKEEAIDEIADAVLMRLGPAV